MSNNAIEVENGLDLVLLVLKCQKDLVGPSAKIEGSTRLQKLLFLLWKEGGFKEIFNDLYGFKAYDFGPCLDDLYDDIEFAESVKLIRTELVPITERFSEGDSTSFLRDFRKHANRGVKRKDFDLDQAGEEAASDLWNSLDQERQIQLQNVVKRFGTMNIRDLLRYVYGKYPKFTEKSRIAGSL